jgi:hypothetical protein
MRRGLERNTSNLKNANSYPTSGGPEKTMLQQDRGSVKAEPVSNSNKKLRLSVFDGRG